MINANALLSEQTKPVVMLSNTAPSSTTPAYVSMKGAPRLAIYISVLNGTTVTGSAITLKQATAVAGTGEKALAFTNVRANLDCAATDTFVDTAVVSNTFTTNTTNSKSLLYEITVDGSSLDTANSFDCVRVGTANAVNATVTILAFLYPHKFAQSVPISAILD